MEATADEDLESLYTVLIGINPSPNVQKVLESHAKAVGYSNYIPLEKADEKSLSKLTGWISQQILSQSQSLGTGKASTSLTF